MTVVTATRYRLVETPLRNCLGPDAGYVLHMMLEPWSRGRAVTLKELFDHTYRTDEEIRAGVRMLAMLGFLKEEK